MRASAVKAINNGSACSVLFLSTAGFFHFFLHAAECSNVFLSAGNSPGLLKNSTKNTEPLFITLRQFS